jgi:hypothetical protein
VPSLISFAPQSKKQRMENNYRESTQYDLVENNDNQRPPIQQRPSKFRWHHQFTFPSRGTSYFVWRVWNSKQESITFCRILLVPQSSSLSLLIVAHSSDILHQCATVLTDVSNGIATFVNNYIGGNRRTSRPITEQPRQGRTVIEQPTTDQWSRSASLTLVPTFDRKVYNNDYFDRQVE